MTEKKTREFEFRGVQKLHYPGHQHPEQEGILFAEPGEVIDFGDGSPPHDGLWYDAASGEQYLADPPPSVEDATPAQGDAEDPEE